MASAASETSGGPGYTAVKLLVAGGFGVGKTTLVGAVSEIDPLRTEEVLTELGDGVDDLTMVARKGSTTVAMDFGRITVTTDVVVYLFGTPGQERFWFLWDELATGALGGVVLADTRRLAGCFSAVDFFERRGIPFVVGVNQFEGAPVYTPEQVHGALRLGTATPVVSCDARSRESCKNLLITLLEHVLSSAGPGAPPRLPPRPHERV